VTAVACSYGPWVAGVWGGTRHRRPVVPGVPQARTKWRAHCQGLLDTSFCRQSMRNIYSTHIVCYCGKARAEGGVH
jgi:hypothetical protein